MVKIGILAYGSLIEDPGVELEPLIRDRIGAQTPFHIEFARMSSTRNLAPTLVPVESGGCSVVGTILVLDSIIDSEVAADLLWRRETRNENSNKHYVRPSQPHPNQVIVESLRDFGNLDIVHYTTLGANIEDLTSSKLADLAIASAKAEAGKTEKDGISYLISVKRQGIKTPLMPSYESEVLNKTGASSLEQALTMCLSAAATT